MPFTLIFEPITTSLDVKILTDFANIIVDEIYKRDLYQRYNQMEMLRVNIQDGRFGLTFKTICTLDDESARYIQREVTLLLHSINLRDFIYISQVNNQQAPNNNIFDCKHHSPGETCNGQTLRALNLQENSIPKEFICSLSKTVMDNPVYIKGNPTVKYNKAHLFYEIFPKEILKDPSTKKSIIFSDIIEDQDTYIALKGFMASTLRSLLEKRATETNNLVSKYKLPDASNSSLAKGLRKAAANNKSTDLVSFIKRVHSVNQPDNKSEIKRTALHWATAKASPECVSLLLEAGGDEEQQDAQGKSSRAYAEDKKQTNITALFDTAISRRRSHLQTFFTTHFSGQKDSQKIIDTMLEYITPSKLNA